MPEVIVDITTSLDGFVTGPNDGPGQRLGGGGECLHNWIFGGPWTYRGEPGSATGIDRGLLDEMYRNVTIGGGASTARQALSEGLVDELRIRIAPVLLGAGRRLFDDGHPRTMLGQPKVIESPLVTHLRYRVLPPS